MRVGVVAGVLLLLVCGVRCGVSGRVTAAAVPSAVAARQTSNRSPSAHARTHMHTRTHMHMRTHVRMHTHMHTHAHALDAATAPAARNAAAAHQPPNRSSRRSALALGAAAALAPLPLAPRRALAAPVVEDIASGVQSAVAAVQPPSFKPPPLGLGAWAWGDSLFWGYQPSEDAELQEVFDYAVANGVRFFDTAELYGLGRSESLLGRFAAASPASTEIRIATKFAALPWKTKPADVLEAAKRSTDRLGRPIDLYQIHFPNAWANEAYWEGLGEVVDAGLAKGVGVSNYGTDAMRMCRERLAARGVPLVSNQVQLSLLYPFALQNGLASACDELGVSLLAYSPLGLGLLTDKFALPDKLPSGPRRSLAEKYLSDDKFVALLATMRRIGEGHDGATPAQVALAWCLAKGACVIPGARNRKQVASNVAAAKLQLTPEEVRILDAAAAAVTPVLNPATAPFPKKDVGTGLTMFDS